MIYRREIVQRSGFKDRCCKGKVSRRGWYKGMVSRRDGTKDGTKEWFLCEGWLRGVVSMRGMGRNMRRPYTESSFYAEDGGARFREY